MHRFMRAVHRMPRPSEPGMVGFMTGQLSPHIQCHRLSCIMIYTLLVNSTHTLGSFRGLGACKTVVPLGWLVISLQYSGHMNN